MVYWDADQDIETADYVEVLLGQTLEVYAFSNGGEGTKSSPAWEFQMGESMSYFFFSKVVKTKNTKTFEKNILHPAVVWH